MRFTIYILFILLLRAQAVLSQISGKTMQADKLINAYAKDNRFSGSVLIYKDGKTLLNKGYGWRDAHKKIPNDSNSIYQIYSITKTFSSTVILKLVEENKLSLHDKLSRFYPGFPNGDSITIEHLLTHSSGLYDYTRGNDMDQQTEEAFIKFMSKQPLDFPPGSDWSYCNSGYWFLGFIIQKITGFSYEEAIASYIFRPLQMEHSGFAYKNLQSPFKTKGYEVYDANTKKEAIVYDPPGPFAAGAIYSTTADLLKYHKALQNYSILAKQMLDKAYTPYKNNYGYGWIIDTVDDKTIVGHSGGAAGYRSNLARVVKEDICIVVLGNTEQDIQPINRQLQNILFNKPFHIPFYKKTIETKLKQYEGVYQLKPGFYIYATVDAGKLLLQATNAPPVIPWCEGENKFYLSEFDGYIRFETTTTAGHTLLMERRGNIERAPEIKASWGITGSATTNGWDGPDLPFEKLKGKKDVWTIKKIALKKGEIKFRYNNDWTFNYGIKNNQLVFFGDNIEIEEGIYKIELDLSSKANPKYKLTLLK